MSNEESPTLQTILDALEDPDCRDILCKTAEPMTANELLDMCNIPRSTLYRKLNLLSTASLVREKHKVDSQGGRITKYEKDFDDITITMDKDRFSVTIERPPRNPDEHLANIWSRMGDEL